MYIEFVIRMSASYRPLQKGEKRSRVSARLDCHMYLRHFSLCVFYTGFYSAYYSSHLLSYSIGVAPIMHATYARNLRKQNQIQSTLVISNSKGPSETLRDIRTSTYQIFRIEDKIIRPTTCNKFICNWTLDVRDISNILWKRGEIFSTIFFTCC